MDDPSEVSERDDSWSLLGSGKLTEVWTNGSHVRRPLRPWSASVHQLLKLFEKKGLTGVPRFVRTDRNFEVLTFLTGTAIRRPWPPSIQSAAWLVRLGAWLRRSHAATRGFQLSEDLCFAWGSSMPSPTDVVTHGDLGPCNMLENDGAFAGVIDWDLARFGSPLDDLAEVAFELGPLRENRDMLPNETTHQQILARIEALCRGYGGVTVKQVLSYVEPMFIRRMHEMQALADAGRAPFESLVAAGNIEALEEDLRYYRRQLFTTDFSG